MPELITTLIKGDKVGERVEYRDALPVNMYAIERNILGAQGYMLEYPGLEFFSYGFGIDRGGIYNERLENHFRVSGDKLISISASGTITNLGTISGNKQVSLPYSFNTQAVVADGRCWLYDPTNGFREITDPDLGQPIDVTWINGYYFFTDGEFVYHSDITDESSIDPLKFATAEFMPDPTLGVAKTQDNKVIVFGRYSIEYFVDRASENFAFSRVETRAQKIGIVATHAKCELDGTFFITGGRKNESIGVYRINVGAAEKVSTREVDQILAKYTEAELSDMRMEIRSEENTTIIQINLPNETLIFNYSIAKKFGIEVAWSYLNSGTLTLDNYRAINGVYDTRNNKWIYGDKLGSNIGELTDRVNTQYGNKVEWILYSPFINLEHMSIDEIEIITIPGFNTTDDATVACSLTEDGYFWGKEFWMQYGAPAEYNKRFIRYRLGYVRHWIGFKFRGISSSRMAFATFKVIYG